MADAAVSNTAGATRGGSTPPVPTHTESQSQSGLSGHLTPDAPDDDDPLETAHGGLGEVTNFPCGFPWECGVAA